MALTSSAALGVSELEGRTDSREDVCTERKQRRGGVRAHAQAFLLIFNISMHLFNCGL